MSWPTGDRYVVVLQHPQLCFVDPELQAGTCDTNKMQVPNLLSGSFASVASLRANGQRHAVRLFKGAPDDQRSRYAAITSYLNAHQSPMFVGFDFQDDGIKVEGKVYPILKMEWAEGETLDVAVRGLCERGDRAGLATLAANWLEFYRELDSMDMAHGDLQHGNVLVNRDRFRLVDYDGMFVPALSGLRAAELGLPGYQHPNRSETEFSRDLDCFAALVIYIALKALSLNPGLWTTYDTGANLIFVREDLQSPANSKLIADIRRLGDPDLGDLLDRLAKWCAGPHYPVEPWLQDPRAKHLAEFVKTVTAGLYREASQIWETQNLETLPEAVPHRAAYERASLMSGPQADALRRFITACGQGNMAEAVSTWESAQLDAFGPALLHKPKYEAMRKSQDPRLQALERLRDAVRKRLYTQVVLEWEQNGLSGLPEAAAYERDYDNAKSMTGPAATALRMFLSQFRAGRSSEAVSTWESADLDSFTPAAQYRSQLDRARQQSDPQAMALVAFNEACARGDYSAAENAWTSGHLDSFGPARQYDTEMARVREHVGPQADALRAFVAAVAQGDKAVAIRHWESADLESFRPAQAYLPMYLQMTGGTP